MAIEGRRSSDGRETLSNQGHGSFSRFLVRNEIQNDYQ